MQLRQLGQSSVKVSPIILGAWAIGGWMWGGTEESEAIEAIQASLDHGVTTIDTAAIYGMGYSEELVAKAIKGRRESVVIATKCGLRWDSEEGSDPWPQKDPSGKEVIIRKNLRPNSIIYECEQSLRRLKTDYLDLYQIHWPDPSTPIEDSWKVMARLKEQGKVKAIGVSDYSLEQLQQAHKIYPIDSLQPPYSIIRRNIEKEILPFCIEKKIGVIVYSPLERGLLTGKVTPERKFPPGDHRRDHPLFTENSRKNILEALEQLHPLAKKYKATFSQLITSWTMRVPGITAALVGARNREQAIENAEAAACLLTHEEWEHMDNIFSGLIILV